ncbi:MAG: CoA pyrophosphatase [Deltaproteobacteria bacterium]
MIAAPFAAELTTREAFLAQVIEKLGTHPCNFQTAFREISTSGRDNRRRAAGVLLPLLFRESSPGSSSAEGSFLFQLIKRSATVPQPGDLSFPGGMLQPVFDRILRPLVTHGPFPIIRGNARKYAVLQNADTFGLISLFLTNALRESWEEIRLLPSRVLFLGSLPTYNLTLFRRTIFPVAGFVENPGYLHPNHEVEKIVEIPLLSFYDVERIGCYQIVDGRSEMKLPLQYPCLIHHEPDGGEEVLWGATFNIIVQFLEIVLNYRLPEWKNGVVIKRSIKPEYLTGRLSS